MHDARDPTPDPIELFDNWYAEAKSHETIRYAHAATLATVDSDGAAGGVDARIVLVHAFDQNGFIFGSDSRSVKAHQLRNHPGAALVFYWEVLERQIRIRGQIELGTDEEGDQTFDDRPRESRITAWASQQSRKVASRDVLKRRFEEARSRFDDSQPVPRPDTWHAYRLIPERIEFWRAGRYRLHKRTLFEKKPSGGWQSTVLQP